jgi:serine protease inhibitor
MALGMTMNGAAGTTFDEMRDALGFFGLSQDQINDAYRSLLDLLRGLDRNVDISVANSVWYRHTFPFEQTFFDTVKRSFDAEVAGLNFDDPASLTKINDWVSRSTSGRIDEILREIRRDDVMYLINAIYFKGAWTDRFEKSRTVSETFRGLDGRQIPVRMMNIDGTYRYAWTPEYQAVELPYGNGAFTMVLLLPQEGGDVNELLASMDHARWNGVIDGLTEGRVSVGLPRFRLEYDRGLIEPLQALGIDAAFTPGGADFTGMSESMGRDLYVSAVRHKTFVDVNEEGTEAAAVTKVTITLTSAPPSIRMDRPFIFAIRERFSGTILFTGKIVEPVEAA